MLFSADLILWHHSIADVGAGLATVLGNLQVVLVAFAAWAVLGERPDALLIPKPALLETQAGQQVYVVDKDNKVASRTVEIGQPYEGQWVVKSGLEKGERVIVEGLQKVRPGGVVDPAPPPAPQGPPPSA